MESQLRINSLWKTGKKFVYFINRLFSSSVHEDNERGIVHFWKYVKWITNQKVIYICQITFILKNIYVAILIDVVAANVYEILILNIIFNVGLFFAKQNNFKNTQLFF